MQRLKGTVHMAQAATHSDIEWKKGIVEKNRQCKYMLDKIYNNVGIHTTLRKRELDSLILRLRDQKLINERKWHSEPGSSNIRAEFERLKKVIHLNRWETRDEYIFWLKKDLKRNLSQYLEGEREFVLNELGASNPVESSWLNANFTADENKNMHKTLSSVFREQNLIPKLKSEFLSLQGVLPSTFKEDFELHEKAPWNPIVFCLCANAFETTIGIYHKRGSQNEELRFYPDTQMNDDKKKTKNIVYFALVENSSYVRVHPNPTSNDSHFAQSETRPRKLEERYNEIKRKTKENRSDIERDFMAIYEKHQANAKELGQMKHMQISIKAENTNLQQEKASFQEGLKSARENCDLLQTQLNIVIRDLQSLQKNFEKRNQGKPQSPKLSPIRGPRLSPRVTQGKIIAEEEADLRRMSLYLTPRLIPRPLPEIGTLKHSMLKERNYRYQ